ncbi:MAG: queuosine salvage family protein, partial [Candidatus Parvarchaeum sp.]
ERLGILREVGQGLEGSYAGHVSNLFSDGRGLFGSNGIIDRIISDFPSFKDSSRYKGHEIIFNKRAQLAVAMIYERFLSDNKRLLSKEDADEITVFADYELPKILHALGILTYSSNLEDKIQNNVLIERDSEQEVELRANTIYAAELIKGRINAKRTPENQVNALNIDYLLWSEGRKIGDKKAHLTVTTNY